MILSKQTAATKKFVSDHRVALAVTATTTVFVALQFRNANIWNDFLKENNLYDKFYEMTEEIVPEI